MHFIDFNSVRFADPRYLWLLAVPLVLLLLWAWRLARYRDDAANFGRRRYLPVYASYLTKYVQAYAAEGVAVDAITSQNEVDTDQDGRMPQCTWPQEIEVAPLCRPT